MRMIEISEDSRDKMLESAEKVVKYASRLVQCFEDLDGDGYGQRRYNEDDEEMGERDGYSRGGRYGGDIGERRGVRGTGPYSRYRYR